MMGSIESAPDPPRGLRLVEELDDLDRQIVECLRRDGRMPFRALGEQIRLSPNATADRVRSLMRRGVISGFTAIVDDRAAGRSLEAVVEVRLTSNEVRAQFEARVRDLPAVTGAVHLTGPYDYQLRLVCSEASEIDATISELKDMGMVRDTQTRVVLRRLM